MCQFSEEDHYNTPLMMPAVTLLLQISIILITARFFAFIFKKMEQASVMGEITAGMLLGPSFLGIFFPGVTEFLFAEKSLATLHSLSRIGLMIFMFVVGMELDLKSFRQKASRVLIISQVDLALPFLLGVGLGFFLYPHFAPSGVSALPFVLFIGTAMSITAFPVLASILRERGMTATPLGFLALSCAAIDDLMAWGLLALIVAIVKGQEWIHVISAHMLSLAFFAGLFVPRRFTNTLIQKLEIPLIVLLPLFFVHTGLRTDLGLLNVPALWLLALGITAVAMIGKFAGSALTARMTGQSWKDSLSLGALMNTRGLMELVVLHVGHDLGILSPEVFTMFVIMALATTLMAAPLLNAIQKK